MRENSSRSAPAEKKYGLPVITSAAQSPASSSLSKRSSDSNAGRPKTVGLVWSAPLSIVTSATGRGSSGRVTRASLNAVSGSDTLPHERGAHAHPFAPSQYLHGERLVELEGVDLVDRQPRLLERLRRRRHRTHAHQLRLD